VGKNPRGETGADTEGEVGSYSLRVGDYGELQLGLNSSRYTIGNVTLMGRLGLGDIKRLGSALVASSNSWGQVQNKLMSLSTSLKFMISFKKVALSATAT
jgi:hypothetical protein